jgi:hypothetical protein
VLLGSLPALLLVLIGLVLALSRLPVLRVLLVDALPLLILLIPRILLLVLTGLVLLVRLLFRVLFGIHDLSLLSIYCW